MSEHSPKSTPDNIIARIESLKKWQLEQQQRLIEQQLQQNEFLTNEHKRMFEALSFNEHNNNSHNESEDLSEIPICSPNKNFNELLEEQLKNDIYYENSSNCKPKRKYLKKGSGLSRYRMTVNDLPFKKPQPKSNSIPKNNKNKTKVNKNPEQTNSKRNGNKNVPNVNRIKSNVKTHSETPRQFNEIGRKTVTEIVNDNVIKIKPITNRNETVRHHLSNQIETKAYWSPVKMKPSNETTNTDYQALLAELIEARIREPTLFDSPSLNQTTESQQQFERELADELKAFEILEQKAANSSFCSTSSLVTRLMEHSVKSTPKRKLNFVTNNPVRIEMNESEPEREPKKVTFAPPPEVLEELSDETDGNETCSSVNSIEISDGFVLKPSITTQDASTNTENPIVNNELLKTRLEQLESELETFRTENARVTKLKSDLETETRNFVKRKRQLEKEVEEQKQRMTQELQEEKAKLTKDRLVYDRYTRELRENKTTRRKERDEINELKSQISSLSEEHKLKESRWGASHARLRNQLRQLEKDNATLRSDNNELRTKNSKLEASQKQLLTRKPSDTKMLHEINKNLTKLTEESKGKTLAKQPQNRTRAQSSTSDKENNRNSLNSTGSSKSLTEQQFGSDSISIEREYDKIFGRNNNATPPQNETLRKSEASSCGDSTGRRDETVLEDGSTRITYPNGNVRTISADKQFIVVRYHNGDVKETNHRTGTVKYLYADSQTWHTTYPDGLELLEFQNGQTEKRYANGASEIMFPNGCRRCTSPKGSEEVTFSDGTLLVTKPADDEKILILPNGQREVHTSDHKRREYPDGTVKLVYPDGVQETRYANGRIRLKDKDGNLIMDSNQI